MSDPHRREFLTAAAGVATLAALAGSGPAAAGDPSFMNNVRDPALADKELPTFKFALDKPARILIGLNTGIYASIDPTQWVAGNFTDVPATNLCQSAELMNKFPHRDVFVTGKNVPGK